MDSMVVGRAQDGSIIPFIAAPKVVERTELGVRMYQTHAQETG